MSVHRLCQGTCTTFFHVTGPCCCMIAGWPSWHFLAGTPDERNGVILVFVKGKNSNSNLNCDVCSVDSLESCETVRNPIRPVDRVYRYWIDGKHLLLLRQCVEVAQKTNLQLSKRPLMHSVWRIIWDNWQRLPFISQDRQTLLPSEESEDAGRTFVLLVLGP